MTTIRRPATHVGTAALCAGLLLPALAHADRVFTESFTSTTYRNAPHTTADWNTASGQLRLFPFAPTATGNYDTPGNARGVAVAGDLAFVTDGAYGLQILDITNPAAPTLVGNYNTAGVAYDVVLSGSLALVADYTEGLQIVNIANPAAPTLKGTYNTPGLSYGVAVSGDLAFVADYLSGLQIIDITNPASPTLKANYNTTGESRDVDVDGDHAFVADGSMGLLIFDINNPVTPVLVGSYNTPQIASGVVVAGDMALVADGSGGLRIVNVTSVTAPTSVGVYDTPGYANSVSVAGDRAYVADGTFGLQIIDITSTASPVLKYTFDTPGTAYGVTVDGEQAFVGDDVAGLRVVRVAQRSTPTIIGAAAGGMNRVVVAGDLAFGVVWDEVHIMSIANPAVPVLVGTYATGAGSFPGEMAVSGNLLLVSKQVYPGVSGDLLLLDITSPASPVLVGTYPLAEVCSDIAVAGDLAFLADGVSDSPIGLRILDIHNPSTPTLVGTYDAPWVGGVAISGNLAVLAAGNLVLLDVTTPSAPILVGSLGYYNAHDVAVRGNRAYVVTGNDFVTIFDISNPAAPTLIGASAPIADRGLLWLDVFGDILAGTGGGLYVFDASNPASPVLVSETPGGYSGEPALEGLLVFTGSWASLEVFQVLQDEVDETRNAARSLTVDGANHAIRKVRLSTTQTAGVSWEVSANNGTDWQWITPDNTWSTVATPGTDLVWRSTQRWAAPGVNPSVSDLRLEWLSDYPVIKTITDIPNDQGRQVNLRFDRSVFDMPGSATPVLSYEAYRRDDPGPAASSVQELSRRELLSLGWTQVGTVAAHEEPVYGINVPTIGDSTIALGQYRSVFFVRAATSAPGTYFDSPADSGYSKDNVAPAAPTGLGFSAGALGWDPSAVEDFDYFSVYGANTNSFAAATAINYTVTPALDVAVSPYSYYFVTATDFSGNEGKPAVVHTLSGVDGTPKHYVLSLSAYPNPFNPETTVRYTVPSKGRVTIAIYDARGARIRRLVDETRNAGAYTQPWDGRDDSGQTASSGVYFARMTHATGTKSYKIVMLK